MITALGCWSRAALVMAAIAASATCAAAQDAYRFVTVRVSDEATHALLSGVRVSVQGIADREWSTDDGGMAMLAVVPGRRATLELRRIGYAPRTLELAAGSDAVTLSVELQASAVTLDTTRVVGEARSPMFAGFDQRRLRHSGSGTFITRDQIERQMALRTTDIVRRAVSVRVVDSSGVLLAASSRGPKSIIGGTGKGGKGLDLAPCVMRVAVDGAMREAGYSLDDISPKDVEGVEVYPGPATVPVEFGGLRKDASCGLVMIWTRRGP